MTSGLMALVVASCFLGQVEKAPPDSKHEAEIARYIDQLGDQKFSVREAASKALWQYGMAAEPALSRALKSEDREVSSRAKRILHDFRYGILPNATAADVALIRQFRDGTAEKRQLAMTTLVKKERFETLVRLLKLEAEPAVRQQLLQQILQDEKAVAKIMDQGRMAQLVELVGDDQDPQWRRQVMQQLFFAPKVMQHLVEKKQSQAFLKYLENEKDAGQRRVMLATIFQSSEVLLAFLEREQLETLLGFLRAETDKSQRAQWLAQLLADQKAGPRLIAKDQFEVLLKFSREHLEAAGRLLICERLFGAPLPIKNLVDKYELPRLIELLRGEPDLETRGTILGALVGSRHVLQQLQQKKQLGTIVELSNQEKEATVRRALLGHLFRNTQFIHFVNDADMLKSVWQLIRQDDNRDWQAKSLIAVLANRNLDGIAGKPEESDWLFGLVAAADGSSAYPELLNQLLEREQVMTGWLAGKHFDTLLAMVQKLPDLPRAQAWPKFFSTRAMSLHLQSAKRLNLVLDLWGAETNGDIKQQLIRAATTNFYLAPLLLDGPHAETLVAAVKAEANAATRTEFYGALLRHSAFVAFLTKQDKLADILEFTRKEVSEDARRPFLANLFNSSPAVTALVEKGHLTELREILTTETDANVRASLFASFLCAPKVAELLLEKETAAELFKVWEGPDINVGTRRSCVMRVINTSHTLGAFATKGHCETLILWVQKEADKNQRGWLLGSLVSEPMVIRQLLKQEQIHVIYNAIRNEADGPTQDTIIQRLMNRSDTVDQLLDKGQLDALLNLLGALRKPETRMNLQLQLLSQSKVWEKLFVEKRMDVVLDVVRSQADVTQRQTAFTRLFSQTQLVDLLIKRSGVEPLLTLAKNEKDLTARSAMFGTLLTHPSVINWLKEKNELGGLPTFARDEKQPAARRVYLEKLFSSDVAMTALIDAGHYDALFAILSEETDANSRAALAAGLLVAPKAFEIAARKNQLDSLWTILSADINSQTRQVLLLRVTNSPHALEALIAKGHHAQVLAWARDEKNNSQRVVIIGQLLTHPSVVKYFVEQKRQTELAELVATEMTKDESGDLLQRLLNQPDALTLLIEHGQFDKILKVLAAYRQPGMQPYLYSRLFTAPKVLEKMVAEKRLGVMLEIAASFSEPSYRQNYWQQILQYANVQTALLDNGMFEELWKTAKTEPNPQVGSALAGRLLTVPKVVERLVAKKELGALLTMIQDAPDSASRYSFLMQLLGSDPAVAALIVSGQMEELVKACQAEPEKAIRARMLGEFMLHPRSAKYIQSSSRLLEFFGEAFQDSDPNQRRTFLQRLVYQRETLALLIEQGKFDVLFDAIESESEPVLRQQMLFTLAIHPQAAAKVFQKPTFDLLTLLREVHSNQRRGYLQSVVGSTEVLQLLLKANQLEKLLELIEQDVDQIGQQWTMQSLVQSPTIIRYYSERKETARLFALLSKASSAGVQQQFLTVITSNPQLRPILGVGDFAQELLAWIKREENSKLIPIAVQQLVWNADVRRTLITANKADVLQQFVALESDPARRELARRQLLFSPSGIVASHAIKNEFEQAEQLLEENASDDAGRLRLASFLLMRNKLDQRIVTVRERIASEPQPNDRRLLIYLLRAKGDLTAARVAAEQLGDQELMKQTCLELRTWLDAARLQATAPGPLPIPMPERTTVDTDQQRVEQLAFLASYWRLAEKPDEFSQTIRQIQEIGGASKDKQLRWLCVKALLLNEKFDDALTLLRNTHVSKAFDLLCYRHQYAEALKLVHAETPGSLDRAWFNKLRAEQDATKGANPPVLPSFSLALQIGAVLTSLGRTEDADALYDLLEKFALEQLENDATGSSRRQLVEQLIMSLVQAGRKTRAKETADRAYPSQFAFNLMWRLYQPRTEELTLWQNFFRQRFGEESFSKVWTRMEQVLVGPMSADDFKPLAEAAEQFIQSLPADSQGVHYTGLGRTFAQRGLVADAQRCYELAAPSFPNAVIALADLFRSQKKWGDAAEQYHAAWQQNREHLAALYLSGDALERAGEDESGRQRKELASQLALESRVRHTLANELLRYGLRDDAVAQFRLVLQTAPWEHWEWNDAIRQLGDLLSESEPQTAAIYWEQYLLCNLRISLQLLNDHNYLRIPSLVHKSRAVAALKANDFVTVEKEFLAALQLCPAETPLSEELIPQLDQAGQRELADKLFSRHFDHHVQVSRNHDDSPLLHNNLAWLAARCHRRLDEALTHAEKSVALSPTTAGHIDTLAEVHFHRGDREAAVRNSQRAIELSPTSPTLRSQLQRFQNAPLPK